MQGLAGQDPKEQRESAFLCCESGKDALELSALLSGGTRRVGRCRCREVNSAARLQRLHATGDALLISVLIRGTPGRFLGRPPGNGLLF